MRPTPETSAPVLTGPGADPMAGEKSRPLLEVEGATMAFGGLVAVDHLDLTLYPGELVGLIGPNGAGKTTAFNMITGHYKPTEGRIRFEGHDITDLPPNRVTALGIARTFQNKIGRATSELQ